MLRGQIRKRSSCNKRELACPLARSFNTNKSHPGVKTHQNRQGNSNQMLRCSVAYLGHLLSYPYPKRAKNDQLRGRKGEISITSQAVLTKAMFRAFPSPLRNATRVETTPSYRDFRESCFVLITRKKWKRVSLHSG